LFSKKSPCGGGRAASPLVLRTRRLQSIFRRPRSAAFRRLCLAHALRVVVVEFYYSTKNDLRSRDKHPHTLPRRSFSGDGSFSFALIYPQPCATIHPPVATDHFERSSTGGAAHGARAFCSRKTKSDKITFSNSNFLPLKKIEKQAFR
ncbi:MAG: hypothetical protein IJY46_06500, partial [Lentisphaeria bacterium]|nr:hypothetical protein [Lentisphaeria bacterium]